MDAGGLMAYNSFPQRVQSSSTLAVPTGGFASRGKNSHIRNISVPVPNQQDQPSISTPRSSRALLLAGLRTTPKTPISTTPTSVSISDVINGPDSAKYSSAPRSAVFPPKTARGLGLSGSPPLNQNQFAPPLPTPPVSSTPFTMNGDTLLDQQDYAEVQAYAEMLATTNYYLAQRQQQIQQQLLIAQQTQQLQQQLAALQMQSPIANNYSTPPASPAIGMFIQSNAQNLSNTPNGLYQIYNPITGTYNYYLQPPSTTSYQPSTTLPQQSPQPLDQPESQTLAPQPPQLHLQQPIPSSMSSSRSTSRSRSPPKLDSLNQTQDQQLPHQSIPCNSGFRKGHRKASSLSSCVNANALAIEEAPKTSVPKLMLPTTPVTATFAPGHASGTHPVRQPRGPPPLEEIQAKPTTKHEGSKNFAARQRRRAVFRLITAGLERRGNRSISGGTMTPVSENDAGFIFDDGGSIASSLSAKQSFQSLREGPDSPPVYSATSMSGDEGTIGGKLVEVKESTCGGLRTPHLVLDAAEKRRSALF